MRKASMTHPDQQHLDVLQCPNGHGDMQFEKKWKIKGKHQKQPITIELWRCIQCRTSIRITKKEEQKNET